jgi:protein TonB
MLLLRPDAPLFRDLVASSPRPMRGRGPWVVSLAAHLGLIAALLVVPVLWLEPPPTNRVDVLRVLIYDPPPPPPLPLPLGSGLIERARARGPEPAPSPRTPRLEAPMPPVTLAAQPAPAEPGADEPGGSPEGSPAGVPEGMPGGVEGGMVGGVPGGVIGGVIGGTGTGPVPVLDYERPPRALRTPRPEYPPAAFVKKVEGTVLLEILIDDTGHVARVRVAQSIPLLDQAAVDVVRTWRFEPAMKHGRPVASLAWAPVRFQIY